MVVPTDESRFEMAVTRPSILPLKAGTRVLRKDKEYEVIADSFFAPTCEGKCAYWSATVAVWEAQGKAVTEEEWVKVMPVNPKFQANSL